MEKQDLKKIKRKDLLELLLAQTNRIRELEEENIRLQNELNNRKIKIDESGTLAEAALKLNNLFEDAEKAIDDYFYNLEARQGNSITKKDIIVTINNIRKPLNNKKSNYEENLDNHHCYSSNSNFSNLQYFILQLACNTRRIGKYSMEQRSEPVSASRRPYP